MTAHEEWLTKLVVALIGDAPTEAIVATEDDDRGELWHRLSQRCAIGLTQARALECRHLASEIVINFAGSPLATRMAQQCWDRSHKLEAIGMQLAQQYPPLEGNEVMVCRCAMDHREVQRRVPEPIKAIGEYDGTETETAIWVCSHCGLPKHGSATQPAMVVQ